MRAIILSRVALLMLSASCDDEQTPGQVFVFFDTDLYLEVLDDAGTDLLNPGNANAFEFDEIRLFYLEGGQKVEYFNPELDHPRNMSLGSPQDFGLTDDAPYRLVLNAVVLDDQEQVSMFVQWNDELEDEITCELLKSEDGNTDLTGGGGVRIAKVWLNNELIWDSNSNADDARLFRLMK